MKRNCEYPTHPFKQKWFELKSYDDPNEKYCTSCRHHWSLMTAMLKAITMPMNTLYGNERIIADPDMVKAEVDRQIEYWKAIDEKPITW